MIDNGGRPSVLYSILPLLSEHRDSCISFLFHHTQHTSHTTLHIFPESQWTQSSHLALIFWPTIPLLPSTNVIDYEISSKVNVGFFFPVCQDPHSYFFAQVKLRQVRDADTEKVDAIARWAQDFGRTACCRRRSWCCVSWHYTHMAHNSPPTFVYMHITVN